MYYHPLLPSKLHWCVGWGDFGVDFPCRLCYNIYMKCSCGKPVVARGLCRACYSKEDRRVAREQGICTNCHTTPVLEGFRVCAPCLVRQRDAGKRRYHKVKNDPVRAEALRKYGREHANIYTKALRLRVLEAYGSVCSCCGETQQEFLSIDHINHDGYAHRKSVRGGPAMYRWVIKNEFPTTLRLLCMNCNWSYGMWGYCPHVSSSK